MRKSVYDTNNNGIVDSAEKVEGIQNAGDSYYYGTNSEGTSGFFPIPIPDIDLSDYYTKEEVDDLIDGIVIPEVAFSPTEDPTTITVGALNSGYVLANKTIIEVLKAMLQPFVNPNAAVSFVSMTLADQVNFAKSGLNFEKGAQITQLVFNYNAYPNSDTHLGATVVNIPNLTQINISSGTTSTTVTCNFSTNIISTSNRVVTITTDWQTTANETDTLTMIPVSPVYFGSGSVGADVTTLGKANLLASKSRTNLAFNASNNRYIYAYPKSYDVLTSIIDNNNFNVFSNFTRSEQTINFADGTSEVYYVYTFNSNSIPGAVTFTFN
jgi:hypothetical protein